MSPVPLALDVVGHMHRCLVALSKHRVFLHKRRYLRFNTLYANHDFRLINARMALYVCILLS